MAYRRTPAIQARLDAQRADILRAAGELLAEHGYAGASVAAVAARAGVAAGTVYRHFDGKLALAAELFRTVVEREVVAARQAVAGAPDTAARVAALVETFAGRALKTPRSAYALLAEPVDPVIDDLRVRYRRDFAAAVERIVADGVADGDLPPQPAGVVAAALVGAIAEALTGPLSAPVPEPETVSALITFCLRALGAREEPLS